MSDIEISFLRKKVEQHIAPEIAKARGATLKALKEVEAGWEKGVIGQRAAPNGTWSHPSMAAA